MKSENPVDSKLSRRAFLFWTGSAAVALATSTQEVIRNTQKRYNSQNLALVNQIFQNPSHTPPKFGIVTDPDFTAKQVILRTSSLERVVGRNDYIGDFTVLQDFNSPQKRAVILKRWKDISQALPHTKLQIALGGSNTFSNLHPLSSQNESWLKAQLMQVATLIQEFGQPIEIRFLFEMNTLGFIYSPGEFNLSPKEQAAGFVSAAANFDLILKYLGIRDQVVLHFNPTVYRPFSQYTDPRIATIFDKFSLDVYNFCRIQSLFLGEWLFPPGSVTGHEIVTGPISQLAKLAKGKPVTIGELGTFSNDTNWLLNLILELALSDVTELMHFDVDKSQAKPFPEADFRITSLLAQMYRDVIHLIDLSQQPNSLTRNSEVIQIANRLHIPLREQHLATAA